MRDLEYTPPQDTDTPEAQSTIDSQALTQEEAHQAISTGFFAAKSLYDSRQFPSEGCER